MDQSELRDHFAGLAMQALIRVGATPIRTLKNTLGAEFEHPDQPWYFGHWEPHGDDEAVGVDSLAIDAYLVADAMLKARGEC